MLDQVFLQVYLTCGLPLWGEWESCTNRLKEWIAYEFICRHIALILYMKYPEFHELLEKSLGSSRVRIPEELTHLFE